MSLQFWLNTIECWLINGSQGHTKLVIMQFHSFVKLLIIFFFNQVDLSKQRQDRPSSPLLPVSDPPLRFQLWICLLCCQAGIEIGEKNWEMELFSFVQASRTHRNFDSNNVSPCTQTVAACAWEYTWTHWNLPASRQMCCCFLHIRRPGRFCWTAFSPPLFLHRWKCSLVAVSSWEWWRRSLAADSNILLTWLLSGELTPLILFRARKCVFCITVLHFFIFFIRDGGFAVRDQLTVRCYDRVGRWVVLKLLDNEVISPDFNGAWTQLSWTGSMGWQRTTRAGWSPSMRTRGAGCGRRTRAQGASKLI